MTDVVNQAQLDGIVYEAMTADYEHFVDLKERVPVRAPELRAALLRLADSGRAELVHGRGWRKLILVVPGGTSLVQAATEIAIHLALTPDLQVGDFEAVREILDRTELPSTDGMAQVDHYAAEAKRLGVLDLYEDGLREWASTHGVSVYGVFEPGDE